MSYNAGTQTLPPVGGESDGIADRIALFGVFGIDNFGNEASLDVMLRFLHSSLPGTEITCICSNPDRVQEDHGIAAHQMVPQLGTPRRRRPLWLRLLRGAVVRVPMEILSYWRTIRYLRRFDAILLPGTGILDDFTERPQEFPYRLFHWCLSARLARVPVYFVSVGAGPINHPLSRVLMKAAASLASYRSFRDRASREFMEGIGLDVRADAVYPDIVFSLPVPDGGPGPEDGPIDVAVGLMSYHGWRGADSAGERVYREYLGKMARFVSWLLDRGHRVRLVIGDASDEAAVGDLLMLLHAGGRTPEGPWPTAEPVRSFKGVAAQIGMSDVVVATRFHNVVCALMHGKPTVSIGYARKNDVLMADMGLGAFCQHIDSLDVDRLIQQFEGLVGDRNRLRRGVLARTAEYRRQLLEQFARLHAISGPTGHRAVSAAVPGLEERSR